MADAGGVFPPCCITIAGDLVDWFDWLVGDEACDEGVGCA